MMYVPIMRSVVISEHEEKLAAIIIFFFSELIACNREICFFGVGGGIQTESIIPDRKSFYMWILSYGFLSHFIQPSQINCFFYVD